MRYASAGLIAFVALSGFAAESPLPEGAAVRLGTTKFRTGGSSLVLSPDGKHAAINVGIGINVMNLETGEVVARLRDEKKLNKPKRDRAPYTFTFAFASGGKEIVTTSGETEVWVWDAATGKPLRSIGGLKRSDDAAADILTVYNCQLADFVIAETLAGIHKLDVQTGKWTLFDKYYYNLSDVSPDGRWVTEYTDMASVENYVSVVDTKTGKIVFADESGGSYPFSQAPSPDGKFVACTVSERGVQLWEVATKKEIKLQDVDPKIEHGGPLFTPDGKALIVSLSPSANEPATHFGRWNTTTGERLPDWKIPVPINSWVIDHKNNRLVIIAGQSLFRIDIATGKLITPPDGFLGYAQPAISRDGKFAAVGDVAGVIRVWESPFDGKPRTSRDGGNHIDDLVFAPDGKTLFAAYGDRSAGVWDVATGKETATLKAPVGRAKELPWHRRTLLAISSDGKTLVGEAESQAIWAWDVATGKLLWKEETVEEGRKNTIVGCRPVFAPDGSALYYGRPRADISQFEPRTGKEIVRFTAPGLRQANVTRLAISPDGKQLAAHAYSNDGQTVVFDRATGATKWLKEYKLAEAVGSLAFTPNGSAVVQTHADGTIRGFTAADGKPAFTLRGTAGYLWNVQLTGDGKHAITDEPGATAMVWKLPK